MASLGHNELKPNLNRVKVRLVRPLDVELFRANLSKNAAFSRMLHFLYLYIKMLHELEILAPDQQGLVKFIPHSGRQNQRPIVPDEWHNHTGRVAVTVDLSDGRVAIIEQNTKQSNYLKLRIFHTPDIISESWKLLWREQVISHM